MSMTKYEKFYNMFFKQYPYFDGDDDPGPKDPDPVTKDPDPKPKDPAPKSKDPATKTFTAEEVAEMENKYKQQLSQYADDLETFQKKSQMTDQERKDLRDKVEKLRNEALSEKERKDRELQKLETEKQQQIEELSKDRDSWKTRYTETVLNNSLLDAAVKNKAVNPQQIVDMLYPKTELVDELDDNEQPTGKIIPKTTIMDKTKDGKVITVQLPVAEAVKRLSEMESYWNLFQGEGTGGTGRTNRHKTAPTGDNLADAARRDPAEYRKLRRGK